MKLFKMFFIVVLVAVSSLVNANEREIFALGVSERSTAGARFTKQLAMMEARTALLKQAMLSSFVYSSTTDRSSYKSLVTGSIKTDSKPVAVFMMENGDIGVIAKGYTDFNSDFEKEHCKTFSKKIKKASDLVKAFSSLRDTHYSETVKSAIGDSGLNAEEISGAIYTKKYQIDVGQSSQKYADITTTVCVSDIKSGK